MVKFLIVTSVLFFCLSENVFAQTVEADMPVWEKPTPIFSQEFDWLKLTSDERSDTAIIAPTIITDEIALVTDIKGVCSEGVTLHTT